MLHKILKIVAIIISLLAAVWLVRIILAGDTVIADSVELQDSLVTPFIYIAYIIFAIALVFVIVFVLKNLFSNAASLKSTLIALGAFAAVIVISYVLASGKETAMRDGEVLSAAGSRWVETGIYAFYILAVVAVGAMVFSGVKKLAK
jgi:tellurite resistance protein TehA-like permease